MMSSSPFDPASLRDLLAFYADAGVDAALEETPQDRLAEPSPARSAPAQQPAPEPQRSPRATAPQTAREAPAAPVTQFAGHVAVPDEAQALRAREMAREAKTVDELREILGEFDGCNLKLTAKNLVFSDGTPGADLMLVGEAPGRDEDLEGKPFVGRSGKLLDRILAAIGRDRTSAYISNVIPWRPPGNRDPSVMETEICRPFIERHIELAQPKVLVTLGNPSTKLLLNTKTGIMRMRGTWAVHVTAGGLEIPTMPALHPAYLLRNPAHKKLAWQDFLAVQMKLQELVD
jgi:uracil-DNA glycosylase family 4